jgi:hypothetical protein
MMDLTNNGLGGTLPTISSNNNGIGGSELICQPSVSFDEQKPSYLLQQPPSDPSGGLQPPQLDQKPPYGGGKLAGGDQHHAPPSYPNNDSTKFLHDHKPQMFTDINGIPVPSSYYPTTVAGFYQPSYDLYTSNQQFLYQQPASSPEGLFNSQFKECLKIFLFYQLIKLIMFANVERRW